MNMLSGIYRPDSGSIRINGKPTLFRSPKDAISAKIGMVHQHFKLVEVFSAKENITNGLKNGFIYKNKQLSKDILALANRYGLSIDPEKKVYDMSVSEKQTVEILKVLYRGADVLILDEPTAVLTPQEIKKLFMILQNMKKDGRAIVIITHKLNEVMEISDRVTILRKGESVGSIETCNTNPKELTDAMVGASVNLSINRPENIKGLPLMVIENLTITSPEKVNLLDNVSFTVKKGEILGVAAVAGSGQKELCEAIAGLQKVSSGNIVFNNEDIVGLSPRAIINKGISMSFIPEDRLGMGLIGSMNIIDNVILKTYRTGKSPFIDRKEGKKNALQIVKKFDINTPSVYHQVSKLSGGNIQKVLLGREISLDPELIITAYPTRGLDIGASHKIYDVINEQKEKGVGILFVGEDLDVLLELSDRIMVLNSGKVMGIVDAHKTTKEELGLLMMGMKQEVAQNV
jgi:simple sugar transport system ATP-binding protein